MILDRQIPAQIMKLLIFLNLHINKTMTGYMWIKAFFKKVLHIHSLLSVHISLREPYAHLMISEVTPATVWLRCSIGWSPSWIECQSVWKQEVFVSMQDFFYLRHFFLGITIFAFMMDSTFSYVIYPGGFHHHDL